MSHFQAHHLLILAHHYCTPTRLPRTGKVGGYYFLFQRRMVEPSAGQLLCGDPASSITAASYCLNGTKDRGSSVWWVLHLGQYKRRTRSQYTAPVLSMALRLRLSYPDIKKPQEGHSGASVLCTRCASLRGSYSKVYLSVKIIKALPF